MLHLLKDLRDDLPGTDGIKALSVVHGKGLLVLCHGHLLLLIYQLLDGIQGICHIGDTEALGACEIIDRTTFLYRLAPLDTVIYHTGEKRQRTAGGMGHINGIVCIYQQGDIVFLLLLVGIIELLKGGHVLHPACLYADLLSFIPSIGEYQFQGTAHIIEGCIMPSFRLPGLLGFHTTDDIVFPGVLQGKAPAQKGRNDHLIIVIGRQADACPG